MPDFTLELDSGLSPVCGVDEAGRGPLAGPVVAAAVIFLSHDAAHHHIHDSKKLSAKKRNHLYDHIIQNSISAIGIASVEEIDQLNILNATMLAMKRAVEGLKTPPQLVLIDGNQSPLLSCKSQTIIKGDQQSTSIAAASILAKVTRDRIMAALDAQYPLYGFAKHQGYGTKAHLQALTQHAPCPAHRKSFSPISNLLYIGASNA